MVQWRSINSLQNAYDIYQIQNDTSKMLKRRRIAGNISYLVIFFKFLYRVAQRDRDRESHIKRRSLFLNSILCYLCWHLFVEIVNQILQMSI